MIYPIKPRLFLFLLLVKISGHEFHLRGPRLPFNTVLEISKSRSYVDKSKYEPYAKFKIITEIPDRY